MRRYLSVICFLVFLADASGQQNPEIMTGQVSFVSTKNVYVKFKSTAGITAGDTLFAKSGDNLIPVLIVDNLSSLSCLCSIIGSAKPAVADYVAFRVKPAAAGTVKPAAETAVVLQPVQDNKEATTAYASKSGELKQRITGSISVNSYTDRSNTPVPKSQRYRYTLSLDARNIANSKFSFESYISFRNKAGDWNEVKSNVFNALKIFDLAVIYDPNKTTRISLGRRINPRLSNIGAADGIQFEKSLGRFSLGALAGTRPDYTDYGFNMNLRQFGGYVGFNTKSANSFTESSAAIMQQMNGSHVDRRFIYFQHSNSLTRNLYFIGTFEVDLYKLTTDTINKTEKASNVFDPTGLYLSLRYRFSDKLSVSGSYDARKNVVYYETYKTFNDRLLENEMRQGFRLQANYRITRDLSFGLQTGYRFIKSDPRPSKNLYGYLTYSNIPGVNIAVTLSGTYALSSFLNSNIYGATASRDFFKDKLQTSIGYHYVDYTIQEGNMKEIQHIGELNLYWQLPAKMAFGVNYEGTFEKQYKYHRLYLQLRKRF